MKTQKLLLVIGLLGIIASIFGAIKGNEFTTQLTSFICGLSLICGYFEIKKTNNDQTKIK